ncbi:MAG: zinc ribbon domain-containing protein [Desulfobacterales bacterium]|nr:MAG: zinc ribbon domain-containing protein [Desulfobacterales bacterium]
MQCPKCSFEQPQKHTECVRCGIIFEKYRQRQDHKPSPESAAAEQVEPSPDPGEIIKELLFYVKPETNPLIFAGRALFFLIIFIWGLKFIFTPLESDYIFRSFWHLVNLPFHEFGHIIFRPFGRLMTSLGGSIAQVLMPLICLVVFLLKSRDTFAASFALWWTGQNFMDLAPYINDARSLTLPLLGGNTGRTSPYGFHDWEFILQETKLLRYDHALANLSYTAGTILMICAFIWGGFILLKQYRNINRGVGVVE